MKKKMPEGGAGLVWWFFPPIHTLSKIGNKTGITIS
jgi:hypothetical protein